MRSSVSLHNIIIIAASALLLIPFLGYVNLFDWDEINFAECAREMIVSNNYHVVQINFEPFWEKPPLFIWMQSLSMLVFGVNEFAARFPNAICGIITALVLFNFGRKIYDERFGLIWTLTFLGSLLPQFYFKSGIIDPWFNLFIFLGIHKFIVFTNATNTTKNIFLSGLFIGLATLTKGPVAILVFGICVGIYWALKRFNSIATLKQIAIFLLGAILTGGIWFFLLIITGNEKIISEFIRYQIRLFTTEDAGHGGPFFYHFIVLLVGCFPASVFAIAGFRKRIDTPFHHHYKRIMIILFWVVLLLFSITKTKIVHYSSLCYFPLTYLAAYSIYKLSIAEIQWKKWMTALFLLIGLILGTALTLMQFVDSYKNEILNSGLIKDVFAIENLKADVYWSGYEFLIGLSFIIGVVVCTVFASKRKYTLAPVALLFIMLITTNLSSIAFAWRVEAYSQKAAIDFFESKQNKNVCVQTIGYKSYAYMFYTRTTEKQDIDLMLGMKTEKPCFFVSKVTSETTIRNEYPQLKELYRKNGFIFWELLK